ncbi:hypothetical protein Tco_1079567 [Tanacetum coccineum]|uniref:Uncharacterized protein n=1 Tax=Tanacetum coccineum TaxID=301880 RepID=A0ABQ5HS67_9ASTR
MTTNTASSSSAFGGHSESWHSAAALGDYSNGPPSQFPSLLLAEKEECMVRITLHYSPSNKSIARFRLPEEMVRRITRQRDFYFVIDMKDKCVKREGFGMMPIFYNKAKWRWRDMGFTSGLIGNHSSLTHGNRFDDMLALVDKTSKSISTQYPLASSTWEEVREVRVFAGSVLDELDIIPVGLLLECKPEEAAAIIQVVIQTLPDTKAVIIARNT